jgi:hypothetical protein
MKTTQSILTDLQVSQLPDMKSEYGGQLMT